MHPALPRIFSVLGPVLSSGGGTALPSWVSQFRGETGPSPDHPDGQWVSAGLGKPGGDLSQSVGLGRAFGRRGYSRAQGEVSQSGKIEAQVTACARVKV